MRAAVLALTALAGAVASLSIPLAANAAVIYTVPSTTLTTDQNTGGGNNDGTGVWFNPLTGYSESRGYFFPSPLYEDGKFFLLTDTSSGTPQAQIFTEGFFSRGNGVVYASPTNLNPARFGEGAVIGAATGFQDPGAGYPDLGPAYGNWGPGRGFVGLTLRDPTGSTSLDVFYGYADITVNKDYSITLNAFAYEDVRGQAITTSFAAPVPEPAQWALMGMGLAGLGLLRRRSRSKAE